jgi:hypothetical protein
MFIYVLSPMKEILYSTLTKGASPTIEFKFSFYCYREKLYKEKTISKCRGT